MNIKKVSVEKAIIKDLDVYFKGDVFKLDKNNVVARLAKENLPINMSRASEAIIKELGYIGYIEYMSGVELYLVG